METPKPSMVWKRCLSSTSMMSDVTGVCRENATVGCCLSASDRSAVVRKECTVCAKQSGEMKNNSAAVRRRGDVSTIISRYTLRRCSAKQRTPAIEQYSEWQNEDIEKDYRAIAAIAIAGQTQAHPFTTASTRPLSDIRETPERSSFKKKVHEGEGAIRPRSTRTANSKPECHGNADSEHPNLMESRDT